MKITLTRVPNKIYPWRVEVKSKGIQAFYETKMQAMGRYNKEKKLLK